MFLNHAVLSCLFLIVVDPGISRILSDGSFRRNGIMDQWSRLKAMNPCSCTAELKAKYPDHVLCMNSTDPLFAYSNDKGEIEGIVIYYHNRARGEVKPRAADMTNLLWDDCLEKMALNWAQQCRTDRDTKSVYPDGTNAVLAQTTSVYEYPNYVHGNKKFVDWIDQRDNWKYGVGSINGNDVSKYTQMISSKATRIGCVNAHCKGDARKSTWSPGSEQIIVCYYLNAVKNKIKREKKPYRKGKPCSRCHVDGGYSFSLNGGSSYSSDGGSSSSDSSTSEEKTVCHHGLCYTCPKDDHHDCGSLYSNCSYAEEQHLCPYMCGLCKSECTRKCQNGGRVNQINCTCECPRLSSGPNCENLKCPERDKVFCATVRGAEFRCTHRTIAYHWCPYKCGICQYNYTNCASLVCKNFGGVVADREAKTCKCKCRYGFYGDVCEKVNCSKPKDDDSCKEKSCASITKPAYSCPYKCNYCKKGCTEIECLNDGALDQNDCTCKCPKTFYGDRCQHKNCTGPGVDDHKKFCVVYTSPRKCFVKDYGRYWRDLCPYQCGVCP